MYIALGQRWSHTVFDHVVNCTQRKPLPIAYSRGFDHLIGQMLEKDPRLRSSASQLREHLLLLKESSAIEQKVGSLASSLDVWTLRINLSQLLHSPRDKQQKARQISFSISLYPRCCCCSSSSYTERKRRNAFFFLSKDVWIGQYVQSCLPINSCVLRALRA